MSQGVESPLLKQLADELEELRVKGLFRKIRTLSHDHELLVFCGNDYLGLSRHPRVIKAASEAAQKYGMGAGAARLISGTSDLHSRLEEELAQFKHKERALVFGSGYLANLGTLAALAGEKDLIVMDKLCHASLIDGARLSGAALRVYPHKNYSRCEEILRKSAEHGRRILVSDTVFSMDGDGADVGELVRLKEKYDCLLVLDEAHGLGVFGREGRGLTEEFEEKVDCIIATLSKALGVLGGFVAASEILAEHLINFSRPFIFATAPPPALMASALEALHLMCHEPALRERLWKNVDKVRDFLLKKGLPLTDRSPIFPLMVGNEFDAVRISDELLKKGVLIPAIRYPTVTRGKARLRLTVSAAHTEENIGKLFHALSEVFL